MAAPDLSVLAILVATNGEEWLPDAIRSLQAQTYEHLDVIAVDNACTDASGAMLSKAFGGNALALERRVGYGRACGAALKVVSERGTDVDAFLLAHDDAALDPNALEAMVAVMAMDESVGVVGGKLVDWDDPSRLQEIGMSTDRYGRLFSELEKGELDHGQHDGMREVQFCTSASLLVRRSVVERVGLFDPRYVAIRDDLDLCWRARLGGFRVVVTSDARARHVGAALRGRRAGPVSGATRYFSERNRIATLAKNYSATRLIAVLPVIVMQSILTAIIQVGRGRRGLARQILGALQWNIVHAPSTMRARARARRHHVASDADVTKFMVRGAPRLRGYAERIFESLVGEPIAGIEETEIGGPPAEDRNSMATFVRRRPVLAGGTVLFLLFLIGTRSLWGSGGLAGAGLAPFPDGPAQFFREYVSGWRSAGVAGAHPPGVAMLLLWALSVLSFGSTWLAARLGLLVLVPLAAGATYRTAAKAGLDRSGRLAAGLVYGLCPAVLYAFGNGRLPELVLLASAPGLLVPILRGARVIDPDGDEPEWRGLAAGTAGLTLAAALSPWALIFVMGAAAAIACAALATQGRPAGALRAGATMAGGAFLLLFPWSLELLRSGSPLSVGGFAPASGMLEIVRLSPGKSLIGALSWAFPAAATIGAALATVRRSRLAVAMISLALVSVLAAWGSVRVTFVAPRPSLPLTGAALAFAILIGAGVESISSLRGRTFGVPHVVSAAAAVFLIAGVAVAGAWFVRGKFSSLRAAGTLAPAFLAADADDVGAFRILWLGGFSQTGSRDDVRFDLTDPGGETMLGYGVRRRSPAETYAGKTIAAIVGGEAEAGGRLLAPLGVRQIIVRADAPRRVIAAFDRQVDVRYRQTFHGARVYDNVTWLPVAAPLPKTGWSVASTKADPFVGVLAVDATSTTTRGLRQKTPARFSGVLAPGTRSIVLAEPFDPRWRLLVAGRSFKPRASFGFATAFDIPPGIAPAPAPSPTPKKTPAKKTPANKAPATTTGKKPEPSPTPPVKPVRQPAGPAALVAWRGQTASRFLLIVQIGLWLVFAAGWSGRRAIERGER
ncbi:MAG: glycosyltransferase [Actinomycetota bacterium]|nr:glycosyltransferase family 2 protein [Actinomycetota bacterium]